MVNLTQVHGTKRSSDLKNLIQSMLPSTIEPYRYTHKVCSVLLRDGNIIDKITQRLMSPKCQKFENTCLKVAIGESPFFYAHLFISNTH